MLSILIPVYNYDVRGLVSDLLSQIILIDDPIEICLLNDGSEDEWKEDLEVLAQVEMVRLYHFLKNQGRVASRKKLSEIARYDVLLFIDCDAEISSSNYITNYLNELNTSDVVVGGHLYDERKPDSDFVLHWKYGKQIEVRSLVDRLESPYRSYSTFNFCVKKDVFNNYLNSVRVEGYGHEDTLMGHLLEREGVPIRHIDNPLIHKGLKRKEHFLSDVESSVRNAYLISKEIPGIGIKLIKYSNLITNLGLSKMVLFAIGLLENNISNNLKSSNPNLKYLQLYKLKTLLELTVDR